MEEGRELTRQMIEHKRRMLDIRDRLLRIYHGDHAAAQAWLDRPHMLLDGERAGDLVNTAEGRARVSRLLDEIEGGFAV